MSDATRSHVTWVLGLALVGATPLIAQGETVLDLATTSPQDALNGGVFYKTQQQPTGTGYIDPFVRIQGKPTQHGYNTDGVEEFDTKEFGGHNWTHSIQLGDVPIVSIGGVAYREFLLDINEQGNQAGRMLSMNEFQIYLSNSNVLSGFNTATQTFAGGAASNTLLKYDMDTGGDKTLRMDYSQASGSGSGDMFAYVKNDLFAGESANRYLYLYSFFGLPDASDAGFEEWAIQKGSAVVVPLPAAAWAGMALIGVIGIHRRFKGRSEPE